MDRAVVIDLDRVFLVNPFKFREEIRKAEENLGIQIKNGIPIDESREKSVLRCLSSITLN